MKKIFVVLVMVFAFVGFGGGKAEALSCGSCNPSCANKAQCGVPDSALGWCIRYGSVCNTTTGNCEWQGNDFRLVTDAVEAAKWCPVSPPQPTSTPMPTPTPRMGYVQGSFSDGLELVSTLNDATFGLRTIGVRVSDGTVPSLSRGSYTTVGSPWDLALNRSRTVSVGLEGVLLGGLTLPTSYDVAYNLCYNSKCTVSSPLIKASSAVVSDSGMTSTTTQNFANLNWRFCQKAQPTSVTVDSQLCGTRAKNVVWAPVTGAVSYALRIDDKANGWKVNPDNSCPAVPNPGDVCLNGLTTTSFNFNFEEGHQYNIWVHALNACGGGWDAAASTSYSEPVCVQNWTFDLYPVCPGGKTNTTVNTKSFLRTYDTSLPANSQISNVIGTAGTGVRSVTVNSDSLTKSFYVGLLQYDPLVYIFDTMKPISMSTVPGVIPPWDFSALLGKKYFPAYDNLYFVEVKRDNFINISTATNANKFNVSYELPSPSIFCPGPTATPPAPTVTPLPSTPPPSYQCQGLQIYRNGVLATTADVRYGDNVGPNPSSVVEYKTTVVGVNSGISSVVFKIEKGTAAPEYKTVNATCVAGPPTSPPTYTATYAGPAFDTYDVNYVVTVDAVNYGPAGGLCATPTNTPTPVVPSLNVVSNSCAGVLVSGTNISTTPSGVWTSLVSNSDSKRVYLAWNGPSSVYTGISVYDPATSVIAGVPSMPLVPNGSYTIEVRQGANSTTTPALGTLVTSTQFAYNCIPSPTTVPPTAVPTSVPTLVPTPVGCENPVQCSTTVPCCTGFTCNVSMGVCMNPIIIEQ